MESLINKTMINCAFLREFFGKPDGVCSGHLGSSFHCCSEKYINVLESKHGLKVKETWRNSMGNCMFDTDPKVIKNK